ncbi:MAG TPA: DUF302 domain-containing protein [Flavobacteriaceae bacterium]|nr:DUF302 domain-containing protein [Flavobacteriaceae bacterium]
METQETLTLEFYQNLGKLFYAIAAVDNNVRKEELKKLKETVEKEWLATDFIEDTLKDNAEHVIINTFKWLQQDSEYNAKACYNSFLTFKNENEHLFTGKVKKLILKTARAIAASFAGINKQELIMLTKLKLELNKTKTMNYYFTTTTDGSFETVEAKVMALLKDEGFGLITQIDIQQTLKEKLQVDFKKYKILGACNPSFAYKALQVENKIGTMLPCNIILQEISPNTIEVSAINPMVSMQAVKNEALKGVAETVSAKLENIVNKINDEE